MSKNKLTSVSDAKIHIDAIDFFPIINKMVCYDGWDKDEARKACLFYKNFLYLIKKYGDQYPIIPSKEIDYFWHQHILDTEKYHKDCQIIFNQYLHHNPYFGIDGKSNLEDLKNAFEFTQKLYEKEFGERVTGFKRGFILRFIVLFKIIVNKKA